MKKLVSLSALSVALGLTLLLGALQAPAYASTHHQRATAPVSATITICKLPTTSMLIGTSQYFYISSCAVSQLIVMLADPNSLMLQKSFGSYGWMINQNAQLTLQAVFVSSHGNGIWFIFTPGVGNCAGFNLPFAVLPGNFLAGGGAYSCS
ncbi:MAG: hypothetical protein H0U76_07455 [Ktedonobacteraceae bacterium]|nr:hypothetical protein [Ktedonobacteraceae bacterium]